MPANILISGLRVRGMRFKIEILQTGEHTEICTNKFHSHFIIFDGNRATKQRAGGWILITTEFRVNVAQCRCASVFTYYLEARQSSRIVRIIRMNLKFSGCNAAEPAIIVQTGLTATRDEQQ